MPISVSFQLRDELVMVTDSAVSGDAVSAARRSYTWWAYLAHDLQVPITYHAVPAGQPSPLDRCVWGEAKRRAF